MDRLPDDVSARLRAVAESVAELKRATERLRRPEPSPVRLYLLATLLLLAAALCGALLATSPPTVVAPINPTGDARRNLYLHP